MLSFLPPALEAAAAPVAQDVQRGEQHELGDQQEDQQALGTAREHERERLLRVGQLGVQRAGGHAERDWRGGKTFAGKTFGGNSITPHRRGRAARANGGAPHQPSQ